MVNISETVREEVKTKVREIMELAQIHNLPFFFTMAVGETETDTIYIKELFSPQINNLKLKNDTIRKHELIEAGFEPVPPRDNLTLNMEEVFYGK